MPTHHLREYKLIVIETGILSNTESRKFFKVLKSKREICQRNSSYKRKQSKEIKGIIKLSISRRDKFKFKVKASKEQKVLLLWIKGQCSKVITVINFYAPNKA